METQIQVSLCVSPLCHLIPRWLALYVYIAFAFIEFAQCPFVVLYLLCLTVGTWRCDGDNLAYKGLFVDWFIGLVKWTGTAFISKEREIGNWLERLITLEEATDLKSVKGERLKAAPLQTPEGFALWQPLTLRHSCWTSVIPPAAPFFFRTTAAIWDLHTV